MNVAVCAGGATRVEPVLGAWALGAGAKVGAAGAAGAAASMTVLPLGDHTSCAERGAHPTISNTGM